MNLITYTPIVLFAIVGLMLYIGAAIVTESTYITKTEVWVVAAVYTVFASATGFIQIHYNSDLNVWYFDRVEEIEKEEENVNLFTSEM